MPDALGAVLSDRHALPGTHGIEEQEKLQVLLQRLHRQSPERCRSRPGSTSADYLPWIDDRPDNYLQATERTAYVSNARIYRQFLPS